MSEESYPEELIKDGSVIQCDFCLNYYPKKNVRKVKDEIDGEENLVCDICYVPLVS